MLCEEESLEIHSAVVFKRAWWRPWPLGSRWPAVFQRLRVVMACREGNKEQLPKVILASNQKGKEEDGRTKGREE